MRRFAIATLLMTGLGVGALGVVGCSDSGSNNPIPPDGGVIIVVPGTDALPADGGNVNPQPGPDGGGNGGACVAAPTTNVEFLNSCTDGTCFPFANTKARLPLLNADGTLPPAP